AGDVAYARSRASAAGRDVPEGVHARGLLRPRPKGRRRPQAEVGEARPEIATFRLRRGPGARAARWRRCRGSGPREPETGTPGAGEWAARAPGETGRR